MKLHNVRTRKVYDIARAVGFAGELLAEGVMVSRTPNLVTRFNPRTGGVQVRDRWNGFEQGAGGKRGDERGNRNPETNARARDGGQQASLLMSETATYRHTKGVDHWLSMQDVCDIMGISVNTAKKLHREGRLPLVKIGGQWRITVASFKRAERTIFEKR